MKKPFELGDIFFSDAGAGLRPRSYSDHFLFLPRAPVLAFLFVLLAPAGLDPAGLEGEENLGADAVKRPCELGFEVGELGRCP